jgi:cell division septum initiation protein DivIVA
MSVLKLLDELEDVIENCANLPLSGKALIDRGDLLDILKEIRIVLPDEIKQSRWIKQERASILEEANKESEEIMGKAQRESTEMMEKAEEHVRSMIENDVIVKESTKKAKGIIEKAEETAEEIKLGSLKYSDGILGNVQKNLSVILNELENNRSELRSMKEK